MFTVILASFLIVSIFLFVVSVFIQQPYKKYVRSLALLLGAMFALGILFLYFHFGAEG